MDDADFLVVEILVSRITKPFNRLTGSDEAHATRGGRHQHRHEEGRTESGSPHALTTSHDPMKHSLPRCRAFENSVNRRMGV